MSSRACRRSGRVTSINCYRISGSHFNHARRDARTHTARIAIGLIHSLTTLPPRGYSFSTVIEVTYSSACVANLRFQCKVRFLRTASSGPIRSTSARCADVNHRLAESSAHITHLVHHSCRKMQINARWRRATSLSSPERVVRQGRERILTEEVRGSPKAYSLPLCYFPNRALVPGWLSAAYRCGNCLASGSRSPLNDFVLEY